MQSQLKLLPNFNTQQTTFNQQQLLLQVQQQQRLLAQQQHQSNIAALVGGGMGVAPDAIIHDAGTCGRSSVPICSSTISNGFLQNIVTALDNISVSSSPLTIATASTFNVSQQQQCATTDSGSNTNSPVALTSNSEARLKKRLLDSVTRENENNNFIDNFVNSDQPESATKIAKIVSFLI